MLRSDSGGMCGSFCSRSPTLALPSTVTSSCSAWADSVVAAALISASPFSLVRNTSSG